MSAQLRISVRFLDGTFHGRGDGGESEWPPSPLRLYQAIVAAAATQWSDASKAAKDAAATSWFEQLPPPTIVAAHRAPIQPQGYLLYVPDNVGDLVAKSWAAGRANDIANYRTDKFVRPTLLEPGHAADSDPSSLSRSAFPAVHYLWPLDVNSDNAALFGNVILNSLLPAIRGVSRLGWGIDLVVADAAVDAIDETNSQLPGERWLPVETSGGTSLRVPISGTLNALKDRHGAFLSRIRHLDDGGEVLVPVPPLAPTAFRVVTYRRESELSHPPYAVFGLRMPDDSKFAAFDPKWRRLHLSGMLRHAASQPDFTAALGWDKAKSAEFILGHRAGESTAIKPAANAPRLVFLPLPSIEWRGEKRGHSVGAIRRVLVTVNGHCDPGEFSRIVRALEGRELIDEKTGHPVAFLHRQSRNDEAIHSYFSESETWTTATPVVLPGYDDPRKLRRRLRDAGTLLSAAEKEQIVRKLDSRIERLLRKALCEGGIPPALAADAEIEWSASGFFPGADLSSHYSVPDQCRRYRRLHVRIAWWERAPDGSLQPKKLKGPFCVGSGRFFGLGLFVPV